MGRSFSTHSLGGLVRLPDAEIEAEAEADEAEELATNARELAVNNLGEQ